MDAQACLNLRCSFSHGMAQICLKFCCMLLHVFVPFRLADSIMQQLLDTCIMLIVSQVKLQYSFSFRIVSYFCYLLKMRLYTVVFIMAV